MDPAITGALISGGSKLLGGLFGKKNKPNPFGASRDGILGQAAGAREGGEKYGFNPLTLLGVSSPLPGSVGGPAPLSSGQILAGTVGDILMEATGTNDALEEQREKAELDRLRKENEILNAGGAGEVTTRTITTGPPTLGPKPEPDYRDKYLADPSGYTVMRNIAGKPVRVRNDVLYRLDLPPGALYGVAEDGEAVFGEIGGEVMGIGNLGDDLWSHTEGSNIVKRGAEPTLTKEPVQVVKPPAVKYPPVTDYAPHQNPTDMENILKHRYKKNEDNAE